MSRIGDMLAESLDLHHKARSLRADGQRDESRRVLVRSAALRIRAITMDPQMGDEGWRQPVRAVSGHGQRTHAEIHSDMIAYYHDTGCFRAGRDEAGRMGDEERERRRG